MWIQLGQDSEQFDQPAKLRLLEYHQRAEWNALDKYVQHLNIQATFMSALIAGGIVALVIPSIPAKFLALSVPLVMVFLRKFTIESLDRSYQRFLEAAACSRKLEWLLQLDQPISVSSEAPEREVVFPNDTCLDVSRRWREVVPGSPTSEAWIADRMGKGRNEITWRLLCFIFVTALLIPPASWLVLVGIKAARIFTTPWLLAVGSLALMVELLSVVLYRVHSAHILKKRKTEQTLCALKTVARGHSNG